jgi:hypothetical protein
MTRDEIAEYDEYLMLLEPEYFDKAIVGVISGMNINTVCYDKSKVIEILMTEDGMTEDEAHEYFDFNIMGAWVGEHTPVYLETSL